MAVCRSTVTIPTLVSCALLPLTELQLQCYNQIHERIKQAAQTVSKQRSSTTNTTYKPLPIETIHILEFNQSVVLNRTTADIQQNIQYALPPPIVPYSEIPKQDDTIQTVKHNYHTRKLTVDYTKIHDLLNSIHNVPHDTDIHIHNATTEPTIIPYTQQGVAATLGNHCV